MAARTRIRRIGNGDGVTFRAEQLRTAGFGRGEEVIVEAREGQITLSKPDDIRAECRELFEEHIRRYHEVFRALAK